MEPSAQRSRQSAPIVLGYDGSADARYAITEAARLFPRCRAVIVSGWRSVEAAVPAALVALPAGVAKQAQLKMDATSEGDARARAEEGAELARDYGLSAEALALKADGAMWKALIASGEAHDAGVVVVGSRGLSPVKSALLGSVSTGLVHHCPRPVLVVRQASEPGRAHA